MPSEPVLIAASANGPRLVLVIAITAVMLFVVIRSLRRVQKASARGLGELNQMSMSERWRAFKLARSGKRLEDPIERRLAQRWLQYVFGVPTPGWYIIGGVLALGVVADSLLQGSFEDAIASRVPLLILIALGAIWLARLKAKYRATAEANAWDFANGRGHSNDA